jgi:hypothetical protein
MLIPSSWRLQRHWHRRVPYSLGKRHESHLNTCDFSHPGSADFFSVYRDCLLFLHDDGCAERLWKSSFAELVPALRLQWQTKRRRAVTHPVGLAPGQGPHQPVQSLSPAILRTALKAFSQRRLLELANARHESWRQFATSGLPQTPSVYP